MANIKNASCTLWQQTQTCQKLVHGLDLELDQDSPSSPPL